MKKTAIIGAAFITAAACAVARALNKGAMVHAKNKLFNGRECY